MVMVNIGPEAVTVIVHNTRFNIRILASRGVGEG